MSDIKNDYDYAKNLKVIQAKAEARQILQKALKYRSDCIQAMNDIIAHKVTHKTESKKIADLEKHMTTLNRKIYVFRKLLIELKAVRKKLVKT